MQYSEHYELNLIEGTDTVNPLVQDKPNYQKIDTQMYLNECASIGSATEIKTGTVHALTRGNGDNAVFRFTATSNFVTGDTFTVDGISVTALLPSGESLTGGAFIIGSEVIACLKSTLLTVFTNGGTASNTTHFDNQLPSYYTNSANISFDGTDCFISSTNVSDAIQYIRGKHTIFTSSSTGTVAQKIQETYNFLANIGSPILLETVLMYGSAIYQLEHSIERSYTRSIGSSNGVINQTINCQSGTYVVSSVGTSGNVTVNDRSSEVNTSVIRVLV